MMSKEKTYEEACSNFEQIYQATINTRNPIVISREGSESVSVIATAELNSLIETVYLLQSPDNATRLLDSLQRAKNKTNQPQTVEELRQKFGLEEEKTISA